SRSSRSKAGSSCNRWGRAFDVGLGDADGQLTDAQNVGRSLGHADAVARVQDVEQMRALERVLERRPDQLRLQERRSQLMIALEEVAVKRAELDAAEVDLSEDVLRLLD